MNYSDQMTDKLGEPFEGCYYMDWCGYCEQWTEHKLESGNSPFCCKCGTVKDA